MVVWTNFSKVHTKMTIRANNLQYGPHAWFIVSSLLYGTLALNLMAFKNQKYVAYECFYGNGPYGKIPTKKEPIRMLGFTSRLPCPIMKACYHLLFHTCIYSGLPKDFLGLKPMDFRVKGLNYGFTCILSSLRVTFKPRLRSCSYHRNKKYIQ